MRRLKTSLVAAVAGLVALSLTTADAAKARPYINITNEMGQIMLNAPPNPSPCTTDLPDPIPSALPTQDCMSQLATPVTGVAYTVDGVANINVYMHGDTGSNGAGDATVTECNSTGRICKWVFYPPFVLMPGFYNVTASVTDKALDAEGNPLTAKTRRNMLIEI